MRGLRARVSIHNRSARDCCHEKKERGKPNVGKASNKKMANVSGWCALSGRFGVLIG